MQSWKHESLFTELIAEEDMITEAFRAHRRRSSMNNTDRGVLLQSTIQSVQQLQVVLVGHDMESHWIGQLLNYLYRLQATPPAETPEDQFNHLYMLRKWLFWVPVSLLHRQGGKGPAMLTLAHLYATALTLEPLFPDLGSSFCSALALAPLEAIVSITDAMQSTQTIDSASLEIASMMQFPQQAAFSYRARALDAQASVAIKQEMDMYNFNPDAINYTSMGNLSPAFAPSTPHYAASSASASASSSSTPFLEVPTSQGLSGFGYGTSSWGAMSSPGFPPQAYMEDAQLYDVSGLSLGGFRGGFVSPTPIWT